jgi:hypothetical protein
MKKTLLLTALGLVTHFAQAQILELDIEVNREFILTSPTSSRYTFGSTELYMLDGQVYLAPCVLDPSPVLIQPVTLPPCPLGTTGFIIQGDVDGDGIADDRSFWSVESIVTHSLIESFNPTGITLVAAPPSKLARPSGDFRDGSVATFYNVLTEVIKRYDVAYYTYFRSYDGILLPDSYKRHAEQWVPGVYIYNVPLKGQVNKFLPLRLTISPMVEANGFRKGLKGFGLKSSMWALGALDVDARLVTDLVWEGNTPNNTYSTDIIEFSMSDEFDNIVYPVPDTPYRLDSPFLTKLTMIPYVFTKGDKGTSTMKFTRFLKTSTVATDTSSRSWTWPTRFIDSYKGHDLYEFRIANDAAIPGIKIAGNAAKLRAPTADYDGDGLSNVMEFAFSQDDGDDLNATLEWTSYHNDPLSQPTAVELFALGFTAPITAPPAYLDTLAAGVPNVALVTNKRANVGGGITYGYEVNFNTANPKSKWVKLSTPKPGETIIIKDKTGASLSGNPNFTWTISDTIENPPVIGTTSIQASNALPATVRVRSTAAVTKGY